MQPCHFQSRAKLESLADVVFVFKSVFETAMCDHQVNQCSSTSSYNAVFWFRILRFSIWNFGILVSKRSNARI